ncbi:MAG: hypothetical protein FWB80_05060 [Defluviitaleaceae bacterium]|nr:hypothetical protein [Defluviitaleaceae bacterium]
MHHTEAEEEKRQQEERVRKEQSWIEQGLCSNCGGSPVGLLIIECRSCGKKLGDNSITGYFFQINQALKGKSR